MQPAELLALMRRLEDRRERERTGLARVEGVAPVLRAHAAGAELVGLLHDPILLRSGAAQRFVRRLRAAGVPTARVTPGIFRALSLATRASGLAALVRARWRELAAADPRQGLCWLVLERIRSPGNLGTILRTAEAVGVGGVIFLDPRADPWGPAAVRASMGGVFGLELARCDLRGLAAWARERGVQLLATSPTGEQVHTEVPLRPPVALLVGDERQGLSSAARQLCTAAARIPIPGRADSLNVAVATGVLLYELLRRTNLASRRG